MLEQKMNGIHVGKPISDSLGIKTYFITIGQDPSFIESVKKEIE